MKNFAICLFITLAALSCQKTDPTPEVTADVIIDNTPNGSPTLIDGIAAIEYPTDLATGQEEFDWENLEYLPLPAGTNAAIPMPWSNSAKRCFSDDIRYDMKKSDGWALYLSSFSGQMNPGVKTFTLYNKYSGIIRYYYYAQGTVSGTVADYNILLNEIKTIGTHSSVSPVLNFANQKIVDLNTNATSCFTIDPQQLSDATWFAWEYELAFDKDIYAQNPNSFMLGLNYGMIKKNSLILNGKQLDNLSAKIRFSDAQYGFGDTYSGDATLILYGKNDLNQTSNVLSVSDLAILDQTYKQQKYDNLLNATINYNSIGEIQWNANLSISSPPNGVGLPGGTDSFVVSGADNSVVIGLSSFYTKAPGVFYLNSKPEVGFMKLATGNNPYIYTLDTKSVEYIFNPAVTEIADIKNIAQEVVATQNDDIFENFSQVKLYTGQKLSSNIPLVVQGVRVSFDVVPKDGGKTVHIVKTFKADITAIE